MAALEEAALSVLSASSLSSSSKFFSSPKPLPSVNLNISYPTPSFSLQVPLSLLRLNNNQTRKPWFVLCSAVQEAETAEEEASPESSKQPNLKRKLFVFNLPWSFSVVEIRTLFAECGTVKDVEIVKQDNGRSRCFAFVTMCTGEEAQAVVEKFDSHEVSGRIIKVEFAKRLRRPSPPRPADAPAGETRHKLYVSNLAWKVRSNHLRELFSADFNPVSARVIFESRTGKSAGYGFVSFATKEEAEAAISALNGKPLMDRPLQLKFCDTNVGVSTKEDEELSKSQPSDSPS